jgi:hypothetical protein
VAYSELNNTQRIIIEIKTVSGSIVKIALVKQFKDGTETTIIGDIDVDKQIMELPYSALIIRAKGNTGEAIYPNGGHATLGNISTRDYPVGQLETINYESKGSSEASREGLEIYFHRSTGVAAEYRYLSIEKSGTYSTTVQEILILQKTNAELRQGFPMSTTLIIAIPSIIIVIGLIILLRRRRAAEENQPTLTQ